MASVGHDTELRDALEAFETAMETPLVSGEHAAWSERALETWSHVQPLICRQLDELHPKLFEEIFETDSEMGRRVELLEAEDQHIRCEVERIGARIAKLCLRTPFAERDEARTSDERETLVNDGIALAVRVRKQEVAIQTWLVEAFNRERGAGD